MKIFISYSANKEQIQQLTADLTEVLGHQVWFDKGILGGQQWWEAILDEIRNCDVFITALTLQSLESEACKIEWQYAKDLNRGFLPVLMDAQISNVRLPPFMREIQWVRYIEHQNVEKRRQEIVDLRRAIEGMAIARPLPNPLPLAPEPPSPNGSGPAYSTDMENRIPLYNFRKLLPPSSRLFTLKQGLQIHRQKFGSDIPQFDFSQGDSNLTLPGVPQDILEQAHQYQLMRGTSYESPLGSPEFRKITAEQYWNLDPAIGWSQANIIFVQGGRDGLANAYDAMLTLSDTSYGDVLVITRVPWISYQWGPTTKGLNTILAPGEASEGWRYTYQALKKTFEFVKLDGRRIAGLILSSPDNPTGLLLSLEEQIEISRAALEIGYPFVLLDWMCHWLTDTGPYDINQFLMAFTPEERERLIFLDGLTKSLGAANIRSAHLLAGRKVINYIATQLSHTGVPSFYPQAVAIAAYEKGFAKSAAHIISPVAASRRVLQQALVAIGIPFIIGGGFYAFLDMTKYIDAMGMEDSERFGRFLAEQYGILLVPGLYYSDAAANWMRLTYAMQPDQTKSAIEYLVKVLNSL
ncbi:MAG: aminotransferase class I/II-fold pyridoxal phosphate-dependent enzyme [Chloroflexi bacterium]|nr:aminotransferase class I/II-fold pyridoxal phosphate-dependent enzyme [Chloroflexota bacterium]